MHILYIHWHNLFFYTVFLGDTNGELVCEGHGYDIDECYAKDCCHWYAGEVNFVFCIKLVFQCWSSVGSSPCLSAGGQWVCEGRGHSQTQCLSKGCCHWLQGKVSLSDLMFSIQSIALCRTQKRENPLIHLFSLSFNGLDKTETTKGLRGQPCTMAGWCRATWLASSQFSELSRAELSSESQ